uniref:Uncharacterized protein n=1 Tax=Pyxicephalus adspersus TaxID=30357 RepID=A0AAV3AWT2_PYXAD|nr:TPA: hypothetical protein GDO54_007586 [Pyxicephalus adspersus]
MLFYNIISVVLWKTLEVFRIFGGDLRQPVICYIAGADLERCKVARALTLLTKQGPQVSSAQGPTVGYTRHCGIGKYSMLQSEPVTFQL